MSYLKRLGNEVLAMKFGLETIRQLCDGLGNPQARFPAILVAGTNGKGSVARFLSSCLTAAGYRTALFTSPHLIRLEERFVVNGEPIAPERFASCFSTVVRKVQELTLPSHPTFFEMVTATAFQYFAEEQVEWAVLEVGMGGRLDSTNIVEPALSVITPIGMDHCQYLGESISKIAFEKAGIFRKGRPAILAPQAEEASVVLRQCAAAAGAEVDELDSVELRIDEIEQGRFGFAFHGQEYRLAVHGRFQAENGALAVRACEMLGQLGWSLPSASVIEGIEQTLSPGVLQRIAANPVMFVDGGHNPDAAYSLARFVDQHTARPRTLVFGIMKDKDIDGVANALEPHFERVHLSTIESVRSATLDTLRKAFPRGVCFESSYEAVREAVQWEGTVVIAGSFYLAGEVLRHLRIEPSLAKGTERNDDLSSLLSVPRKARPLS